jgi:RNA polymerase sigma-70 factor (ECF subfamily)
MRESVAQLPLRAAAFSTLMDRTQEPLWRFVRELVGEPEQARDVVQDVFVDAWKTAQRASPPFTDDGDEAAMRRWIFHAGYHRAISVLRRRRVIPWESLDALNFQETDHTPTSSSLEDQIIESAALQTALAALTPDDLACVLLNAVQGFTSAEIAQIVGIAPEAAKKRLTRAKQRLRDAYLDASTVISTTVRGRP